MGRFRLICRSQAIVVKAYGNLHGNDLASYPVSERVWGKGFDYFVCVRCNTWKYP